MLSKLLTAEQEGIWNAFAAREPRFAILQSWQWGAFKEKLGWKAFRIAIMDGDQIIAGAQMLIRSLPGGIASVAYIPRGPIGNWLDPQVGSLLFTAIHAIASRSHTVFLKIEPPVLHSPEMDRRLEELGFCRSTDTNQPRASIVLDLRDDLDTILLKMRKKTRQYIHNALREGMDVRLGDFCDIPAYIRMMQDTAKRERFSARSQRFYSEEYKTFSETDQCVLFLAFHQEKLIAVRTAYSFGRCAAEFHGGSAEKSTALHPNYLLVWKAIQWAKERGCESYDMWGIPDEIGQMVCEGNPLPVSDRTDGLWGVYRFKTGFSKTVEYYAGAFDYIYRPRIYRLINHVIINTGNIEALSSRLDPRR